MRSERQWYTVIRNLAISLVKLEVSGDLLEVASYLSSYSYFKRNLPGCFAEQGCSRFRIEAGDQLGSSMIAVGEGELAAETEGAMRELSEGPLR